MDFVFETIDRKKFLKVIKEQIRSYCEDCERRNAIPYFSKSCPNPEEEWENRLAFVGLKELKKK